MVTELRPQILDYPDYRKFLEDFYNHKKKLRNGFSFRRFSQLVGISSPNYLQLVMKGQRNLSSELAVKVAKVLGLSEAESQYFCALVEISGEGDPAASQKKKLSAIKALVTKPIPKAQFEVLNQWYHLVVRELVLLPDFEPTGEWISAKLKNAITAQEAKESLQLLISSGFLRLEGDGLVQTDPVIDTGDGLREKAIIQMHLETLKAWGHLLSKAVPEKRELGLLTIPIAKEKIPELKRRVQAFQDEIIGWVQDEKNPQEVVQLGTYVIPVTQD